jgi:hypothetical protein
LAVAGIALLLVACPGARAGPSGDIAAFASRIEAQLRLARYMEGRCVPVSLPEWASHDTQKCSYAVTDEATGKTKHGLVILLDPPPRRLSAWIVNACQAVRPLESGCPDRLFRRVLEQSGGQFPVAGIVYEDILPRDGVYEAYGFRNGVTTILQGVEHRRVEPFSPDELEAALVAPPLRTASEAGFARLVGISRDEYSNANPAAKVNGLAWLDVVRDEHRKAMNSERNFLLEAWLASHAP